MCVHPKQCAQCAKASMQLFCIFFKLIFTKCSRIAGGGVIERRSFQTARLFAAERVFVKPCAMPPPVRQEASCTVPVRQEAHAQCLLAWQICCRADKLPVCARNSFTRIADPSRAEHSYLATSRCCVTDASPVGAGALPAATDASPVRLWGRCLLALEAARKTVEQAGSSTTAVTAA